MKTNDFEIVRTSIEQAEAGKILEKVNKMAKDGATMMEVQMYLYNNWVGKTQPESIISGYEK